ncbi:MAG TPA: hypothetical protein VHB21_12690, partial [Minicystis sp.]|nr:hypothetical protein [Minicystis sp.]
MRPPSTIGLGASLVAVALAAGCGGPAVDGAGGAAKELRPALATGGHIDVEALPGKPRLTLVTREGDPVAAAVAAVVTDLGPVATTALAAVVEARVRAA